MERPQGQIRQESDEAVLSGGFGYFFGNSPIWNFGSGWQTALNSQGSRDMARIAGLLVGRRWDLLVPDANGNFLVSGRGGSGSDHAVAARASDGSFGVAYVPTARSNVQLSLAGFSTGTVRARWYDPTSGAFQAVPGHRSPPPAARRRWQRPATTAPARRTGCWSSRRSDRLPCRRSGDHGRASAVALSRSLRRHESPQLLPPPRPSGGLPVPLAAVLTTC